MEIIVDLTPRQKPEVEMVKGEVSSFGYKRRFSLEQNFMNYTIDDILFGAMYYFATFHPTQRILYLTKKNFTKYRNDIKNLCNVSTQTLNNHLKKLIEKGLIQEAEITSGEVKYPSYTFPHKPEGEKYQLIDNEMLWYICSTRNQHAVKIYVYLLNKYMWKREVNETYIFTMKELIEAIGYANGSNNAVANSIVKNILESFLREGVIRYEDYYEERVLLNGTTVPVPQKRLLFVASSKKELPATKA